MKRMQKLIGTTAITVFFLMAGLFSPLLLPKVHSNCISITPRFNNGILTAPNLLSPTKFGNPTGQCVIDPIQAGIVIFKIPTYDQLKNTYFERKVTTSTIDKQTFNTDQTNLDFTSGSGNKLWYFKRTGSAGGNLTLTACPSGPGPACSGTRNAVIFVDGNLNIGDLNVTTNYFPSTNAPNLDIRYDDPSAGIVYIVKGSVNFGRNVRRFDGVIIAQGAICTGVDNLAPCPSGQKDVHGTGDPGGETKQLTVYGNLVSLDPTKPIQFQRNLLLSTCGGTCPNGNDDTPAEIVNVQPKYLVVMKDLLSETFTIQTEDTHYAINQ